MKLTDILLTDLSNPDDDRAEAAINLADVKLIVHNNSAYHIVNLEADDGTLCIGIRPVVGHMHEMWLADKLSDLFDD